MARSILTNQPATFVTNALQTNASPRVLLSPKAIADRLRQRRSKAYVDSMKKLDAGGHTANRQAVEDLLNAIQSELPEISIDHYPIGIVAKCFLGHPYEVHTLDRTCSIIEHYKFSQPLPSQLDRARGLAVHPGYAFIEVYADKLIAVSENGETSIVK